MTWVPKESILFEGVVGRLAVQWALSLLVGKGAEASNLFGLTQRICPNDNGLWMRKNHDEQKGDGRCTNQLTAKVEVKGRRASEYVFVSDSLNAAG